MMVRLQADIPNNSYYILPIDVSLLKHTKTMHGYPITVDPKDLGETDGEPP